MSDDYNWPIATYTVELIRPNPEDWLKRPLTIKDRHVMANLPGMLRAAEENLTDLLPPDYRVEIKEWST